MCRNAHSDLLGDDIFSGTAVFHLRCFAHAQQALFPVGSVSLPLSGFRSLSFTDIRLNICASAGTFAAQKPGMWFKEYIYIPLGGSRKGKARTIVSLAVVFLLVFDPAKPAVLRDKLPDTVNYTRECVDMFLKELDKRGIKYVDNTQTLKKLQDSGTQVFNKKYDANHWNDTGAFYGTQNSLKELNKQDPRIHVNELSEFDVGEETKTTLPVSKFPINESVPVYTAKTEARDITESFKGLPLDSRYRHFVYTVNDRRKAEGSPRALIFQGSYINSYGRKYYENAFGECVEVHNYQNVLSFPQYYHLFDPQVVIFELAEYTMRQTYFDYKKLKSISFNDELSAHKDKTVSPQGFSESDVTCQTDQMYTTVTWKTKKTYAAVWLTLDKQYDMQKTENGYTAIVPTAEKEKAQLKVLCLERLDK